MFNLNVVPSLSIGLCVIMGLIVRETDGQCSSGTLLRCIAPLSHKYQSRFEALQLGFNETQLNTLCSDINSTSLCLSNGSCTDDNTVLVAGTLWIAAKQAGTYLCTYNKPVYLSYEKCYEQDSVSVSFQQCLTVTAERINKEAKTDACRLARTFINCMDIVSLRACGSNATQFMRPFFYLLPLVSGLQPGNCSYVSADVVQGPCNITAINFCANLLSVYFDPVSATAVVPFHDLSNFNNTCRYVDWMSGCLNTYGCDDNSVLVQNSWTRYRDPLVHLCYDQRQVAQNTFSSASATCNQRNVCYTTTMGNNSAVRSDCPQGFTLYTSQKYCPVTSMSQTLKTSLSQFLSVLTAAVLVASSLKN